MNDNFSSEGAPESGENKKKLDSKSSNFKEFFSKKSMLEEATNYKNLKFFGKSKNVMAVFFLAVTVIAVLLSMSADIAELPIADVLISAAVYLVLTAFVYINHRWAMVLLALLYSADKVVFILQGLGSPLSQLIFLGIAVIISYRCFMVATYLKKTNN